MIRLVAKNILAMLLMLAFAATAINPTNAQNTEKISRVGEYRGYSTKEYKGFDYHSTYITMPDGVQLAADIFLPKKLKSGTKVPTILYLTRYVRSLKAKKPYSLLKDPVLTLVSDKEVNYFTSFGYAIIVVDVRGTGASTGKRTMEFSPREVADGSNVVDWIVAQPWSNGKVGTTGISYLGTTAELLLVNQNPAVKACIPRSNIFDLYGHIMFPGGVRQGPFVQIWGKTTGALDHNDFSPFGKKARKLVWGIHPVDGDTNLTVYHQALHAHLENFDVYKGLENMEYRDDRQTGVEHSSNEYSIHSNIQKIANSGTAIYRIGGWYDSGLQESVIAGYLNTPNTYKALIGPWDHGPANTVSPWAATDAVNFDIFGEMLRFYDHYLKGIDNGIDREKPLYYFTVGAEQWDSTKAWPPVDVKGKDFFFSTNKDLTTNNQKVTSGAIAYKVDTTCGTDSSSRWNSLTPLYKHGHTHYPDRAEGDKKMLCFTSAPLDTVTEITGHPVADLYVAVDDTDAEVFCYIEDVSPNGAVVYVTEGMLRAMDRKELVPDHLPYKFPGVDHSYNREDAEPLVPGQVTRLRFNLLPISYVFQKGHSVRIAIAGSDKIHFDLLPKMPTTINVQCGSQYPSMVTLPIATNHHLTTVAE